MQLRMSSIWRCWLLGTSSLHRTSSSRDDRDRIREPCPLIEFSLFRQPFDETEAGQPISGQQFLFPHGPQDEHEDPAGEPPTAGAGASSTRSSGPVPPHGRDKSTSCQAVVIYLECSLSASATELVGSAHLLGTSTARGGSGSLARQDQHSPGRSTPRHR